jgi:hypothetical protein
MLCDTLGATQQQAGIKFHILARKGENIFIICDSRLGNFCGNAESGSELLF